MGTSGISSGFPLLSQSSGQVAHVLRTRSPLGLPRCCHRLDPVRLACMKHAASVRPEPGSNSPSRSHPPLAGRALIWRVGRGLNLARLAQEPTVVRSQCILTTAASPATEVVSAVARTGFWLFLFRSQGATTGHASFRKEVPSTPRRHLDTHRGEAPAALEVTSCAAHRCSVRCFPSGAARYFTTLSRAVKSHCRLGTSGQLFGAPLARPRPGDRPVARYGEAPWPD